MKHSLGVFLFLIAIAATVLSCGESEVERRIETGEFVVAKGNVYLCPFFDEYFTGYARVPESGEVTLFGYTFPVVGLTPAEVQSQLIQKIGNDTGRTPETLVILVMMPAEFERRREEIDADIDAFDQIIEKCERELRLNREDKENEVALGRWLKPEQPS